MFIRKKVNKSGSTSVQILKKIDRKNILVETIGCSRNEVLVQQLVNKARQRLVELDSQKLFDFHTTKDQIVEQHFNHDEAVSVNNIGPELIFGKLFKDIGFEEIPEPFFKNIVMARLTYPVSKLKTAEYLQRHHNVEIDINQIYRFLDRFREKYQQQAQEIVFKHSSSILKQITVIFYDMTTLYFETEDGDDLRKIGFSKDGKFQKPQIMLGLLVGKDGYPIGYNIFEENTFEGHTLLPVLREIEEKYLFPKPIVVGDAALLSAENLKSLETENYKFIIGARIKNENEKTKTEILKKAKDLGDGESFSIKKEDGNRLIVNYSRDRAKKDAYNREKGITKLRKKLKRGKLTKEHISRRGYNKFLVLKGAVLIHLDEEKIKQDSLWDGLKGYLTNTKLSNNTVITNYCHLWQIEKAFRISKTDLRIRPIHHYRKRRIEAHICIAFVAYTIWKELERLLKEKQINMSPNKVIELAKTIHQVSFILPDSGETRTVFAKLSDQQKLILKHFHAG